MTTFDQLIQHRRDPDPCQFAELGGPSNNRFQWSDLFSSIAGFAGALIPTLFLVLIAALIGYYGRDIYWLIRFALS